MTKTKNTPEMPMEDPVKPDEHLALAQTNFNDQSNTSENNPEPQAEISRPTNPTGPSFGNRVWHFLVFLFRVVLIFIIVGAIGAGLYFGWPIIYNEYILPVQNNTAQIGRVEKRQEQSNARVAVLETQAVSAQTEQARQSGAISAIGSRVAILETEISAHTNSLAALEKMQTEQDTNQQDLKSDLGRQIKILRGMELLSRARLYLYQSNFGMAKQDVQIARDILAATQSSTDELFGKELTEVVQRLDLCLSRLPDFPVTASDDLDIAWQVLLQGIPQTTPQPTNLPETPTPAATLEVLASATPGQTPTITGTPAP